MKIELAFEGFDEEQVPNGVAKKMMRKVGNKLATRVRKRFRKLSNTSKSMNSTGQLRNSIKFRMNKRVKASGFITFTGKRTGEGEARPGRHLFHGAKTSPRGPMRNFSIAAFQAAKGRGGLNMTEADDDYFLVNLRIELATWLANKQMDEADNAE